MTEAPVVVMRTPSYRTWALRSTRAEAWLLTRGLWAWRVWEVLGSVKHAGGTEIGVRRASAAALAALVEHAS